MLLGIACWVSREQVVDFVFPEKLVGNLVSHLPITCDDVDGCRVHLTESTCCVDVGACVIHVYQGTLTRHYNFPA